MYMKKTNKILVGCLALLLTLVVGYALFSETITINGTAQAKGSFAIETTCTSGVSDNLQDALDAAMMQEGIMNNDGTMGYGYPKTEGGYSDDACTVNDDIVTYSVSLDYPGALRYFIVKTKNTGTISAKLNTLNYLDGAEFIKNETCIYNKSDDSLSSCNSTYLYYSGGTLSGFKSLIAKETVSGELYTFENDELWDYVNDEGYMYIEPNESLYFVHGVSWNENWTDNTKYLTYEGIYELPFVQYTN